MNIFLASSIGGNGSGIVTALVVASVVLLLGAYRRRRRIIKLDLAAPKLDALIILALWFAWLAVQHAATPLVGAVFGVVGAVLIGASAFSTTSDLDTGVFKSFRQWIHSNRLPAWLVGGCGYVVGVFYGHSLGTGILLAAAVVGVYAGKTSKKDAKQVRETRANVAERVTSALGISAIALDEHAWSVCPDGSIVIEQPGGLLLNADRLEERVAKLLPHLSVSEASPARIVLSPLTEAEASTRAHTQRSGGLVTGTTDASAPTSYVTPAAPPTDVDVPTHHIVRLEDL